MMGNLRKGYNNNQSSFKYIETLNSDPGFSESENKIARSAMTTSSDFYYNKVENREIQQKSDGQLIEKKNSKVSWVIGTESKKIDSYLCYKATYIESYIGRKSGKTEYREVVAWFAPSLPYAFGPINFYGLPYCTRRCKSFCRFPKRENRYKRGIREKT